jgi:hypothetical protein
MYFIKLNNKKITKSAFKSGFNSYEDARNFLRKYLREQKINLVGGFTRLGYNISKV